MSTDKKGKDNRRSRYPEARGMSRIVFGLFLSLALVSFQSGRQDLNWLGLVGHGVAYAMQYVFGWGAYLVIGYALLSGYQLVKRGETPFRTSKTVYFILALFSACILLNCLAETGWIDQQSIVSRVYSEVVFLDGPYPTKWTRHYLGGVPAYYLYTDLPHCSLQFLLSDFGVVCTFSILLFVSCVLLSDFSLLVGIKKVVTYIPKVIDFFIWGLKKIHYSILSLVIRNKEEESFLSPSCEILPIPPIRSEEYEEKSVGIEAPEISRQISLQGREFQKTKSSIFDKKIVRNTSSSRYTLPPLNLLTNAKRVDQPTLKRDLAKQAEILEETLLSFGIEAKVGEIHCGPTITSFEVHPAIGVKVQKITTLSNDIALNLQAKSMRIMAPIPGKAAVGVEIPSPCPQEVGFKEMLFQYRRGPESYQIPILLGKTVSGENVLCDLTKMPHCIIAGATGSGKSVCINTIIMSMVMNMGPEELKLVLIDPKKVELTPYTRLPHMIAPVITEPSGAYAALHWIVKEMTSRYELLKQLGVRNISAFNERTIDTELEESLEGEIPEKLPYIVAIIDEFADLMMSANADLETPIARIAQMARAVGIHLILATQRPSREVITGIIKANFPCRIAFKVASRINSQIILDENGAESLLGNGDMLFLPPGSAQLIRAQGVYIRDEDINEVIDYICMRNSTDYLFASFDQLSAEDVHSSSEKNNLSDRDPLYERALNIVLTARVASTTFLQRKLKIGYARAASLMDQLEEEGVIGPQDGSKGRKILLTGKDLSDR